MKKIIAIVLVAFLLAGCSNNTANESTSSATSAEISSESTSSAAENSSESVSSSVSSTVEESKSSTESSSVPAESSSTTKKEEKPVSSSTSSSSTNKPVSSSSNKPVEKPVSSSTSSSSNKPTSSSTTKIEEKPIHTHTFTEATCTNPATCISCGETKGTTINHNYNNGSCIYCGKNDPNYVAPHNCKYDGHIWNNSYTESSTENVEIVENHTLSINGYDYTLAGRYFGDAGVNIDFTPYFGTTAFGSGSSKVKTTGVKTITRFIHECSECGYKEVYNTEETVTPGETWVFVGAPLSKYYPIIWWDINNIPDEVYEAVEREQKAFEEWKNSL